MMLFSPFGVSEIYVTSFSNFSYISNSDYHIHLGKVWDAILAHNLDPTHNGGQT